MSGVYTYLIRIFIGGLICFAALLIADSGVRREVVRLCCGCLMIILFLTPVSGFRFDLTALTDLTAEAELKITGSTDDYKKAEYQAIASQLCEYIQEQAANRGIRCRAGLSYEMDEENIMRITGVIMEGSFTDGEKQILMDIVENDLGGRRESVQFTEGG